MNEHILYIQSLKIYDKYFKFRKNNFKSTFQISILSFKKIDIELPEANLTSVDINEIDISYESTLKPEIYNM